MALRDEVLFSLRIFTTDNTALNNEVDRWISAAILDLSRTADIAVFTADAADAYQKEAIITYCHYQYEQDTALKDRYLQAYESQKSKMRISHFYRPAAGGGT